MSNLPNSFTAASTAAFTSASFPTSALAANAFTFGKRSTIRAIPFSAFCKLMSTRTTFAPSCAKRIDDSSPIPLFSRKDGLSIRNQFYIH